jgi:arsenite oxidase small subunit
MKRCRTLVDVGRRQFLRGTSIAAAGLAATATLAPRADAAPSLARVSYPSNRLGNVKDLEVNQPLDVSYPDADAPGVLLKLAPGLMVTSSASPPSARIKAFR